MSVAPVPISALDLVPLVDGGTSATALADAERLAHALEGLGYGRLWYAEHHNMPGIATTAPEILIAHVAARTERLRLGAGGVMLPNHAPLRVAEVYRLLEALHPGRIDLGIGRAPGTDPLTAVALRRARRGADEFPEQLAELRAYDSGDFPEGHPFAGLRAMPDDVRLPPIWLLGSSDVSARAAAALGLGFAFAGHFSPDDAEGPMRAYRASFRPGPLERPHAILALSVFCQETHEEAERLASSMLASFVDLRQGRPTRLLRADEASARRFTDVELPVVEFFRRVAVVGTPETVRPEILRRVETTAADEVMVVTHAHDVAARVRSYALVAGALAAQ